MHYYLLTNPKFKCHYVNKEQYCFVYKYNPSEAVQGGRVNYPTLNPRNNITLDDLRGLNLTGEYIGVRGPHRLHNPLNGCIINVQRNFGFYFDRRFGRRDDSDKDSNNEDEKIEEETRVSMSKYR